MVENDCNMKDSFENTQNAIELKKRVLSAVVLVCCLVGAILWGERCFQAVVLIISACIFYEWIHASIGKCAVILSILLATIQMLYCHKAIEPLFAVSCIFLFNLSIPLLSFILWGKYTSFEKIMITCFGISYVFISMSFFIQLYHITNPVFILWILLSIWLTDTGAFFFGKLIGGKKLMPHISPGKTWAGFIGGTLTALMVCSVGSYIWRGDISLTLKIASATTLVSLCAHAGDLLESCAKRYLGVKDLGSILPGHGGMADRFDSLLMVNVFLLVCRLIGFWI